VTRMVWQRLAAALPISRRRRRPFDAIYSLDDRPPLPVLVLLSLQHVAIALPSLLFLTAFRHVAGITETTLAQMMSASLIGMAAGTAWQAWGGRWGSGTFLVHSVDPVIIGLAAAAVATAGPGALAAVSILAGVTALCISPLLPRLRTLFPTPVVGTIIIMVGISLIRPAFTDAWDLDGAMHPNPRSIFLSTIALVTMVGLSVWGGRMLKLLAVVAGLLVGLVAAALMGEIHGLEHVTQAAWIAPPHLTAPRFELPFGIVIAVVLTTLMNQLENMGGAVMMDRMTDADWKRPDVSGMSGAVRASGLGDLLGACFGGSPTGYNPDNAALASASKATSRYLGFGTAALLLVLALLPKCTALVTLIPSSLRGGLAIYTALFLIVAGIEMAVARALDARAKFTIGIALVAGLVVMLEPGLSDGLPQDLRFVTENGFIVAGVVVLILNAVFRLGTSQRAKAALDATDRSINQQITEFMERQGETWGARRDILQRATAAVLEAAEAINASGGRTLLAIRGDFDELSLNIELSHSGRPLTLDRADGLSQQQAEQLLRADTDTQDIDRALQQVGAALLHHLADKVTSEGAGTEDDPASLKLHFEH